MSDVEPESSRYGRHPASNTGDKFTNPNAPAGWAGHRRMVAAGYVVAVCQFCLLKRWYTKDELALGSPMCRTCCTEGVPGKRDPDPDIAERGGLTNRQRTKKH